MIFFDVTKAAAAGHRSGLMRVSARLRQELGTAAQAVRWPELDRVARADDWFFTAELFSEAERPGFTAFLDRSPCRCAALYHDAIPLKLPHVTWPQSVARHPEYMKWLAQFDRVWAVSAASRRELIEFWQWQEVERMPDVGMLTLGADFDGTPRVSSPTPAVPPRLLCVGILEPRKNQAFLLDVCEDLWTAGLEFELHFVGRVNPHFGRPIAARIASLRRRFRGLHFHEAADDARLATLFAGARACVFPTIAEGCGLPLLESLWKGVPCVCSDLPVLRENADGGGCVPVATNDRRAWAETLRRIIADDAFRSQLAAEAAARRLPTWAEAAGMLRRGLG
jgi:glycosyltransferase involved in cell wall biosynthesis